ncbi:MAG: alcohol dehydrogenase catalytic domain-containing protein [Deltaproteobacteria bacterium]|nr:alcohol dehydrogenase catalytic domain-containing protein [Deltaproteobacteria bacterium]
MKALYFNITVPNYLALQVLGRISKKYYFEGPFATVSLKDVPEPKLPNQDWVKIRVRLCGFCGSDLNLLMVTDSPMASPFTSFPCIFGHELCGDVVETGKGVDTCTVGDLVTVSPLLSCVPRGISPVCPVCAAGRPGNCEHFAEGAFAPGLFAGICRDVGGGFAEYMVAHKSQVFPVPKGVSPEAATLTEPFAVGIQTVLDNRPEEKDRVLVIGGGVIGTMIVKAIRGLGIGCTITVVEPAAFNAEYVRRSGADHVVPGGIIDAALKMTGAVVYKPMLGERIVQGGFDRVFDTVGHSDTLQQALIVTAGSGVVSLVGIGRTITLDPTPLWLKVQAIKGCYGYAYNDTPSGRKHAFEIALELVQSGRVQVEDMLTHSFPIEGYRELIEVSMNKSAHRAVKTAVRFV